MGDKLFTLRNMPGLVAVVAANFAFSIVSVLLFGTVLGGGMYLVLGLPGTLAVLPHPSHSLRALEEEWEWEWE